MIGHLYRYPHPHDPTRFIYVGQGGNRDWSHRSGKSSFGRRFRRDFPGTELPQPIREDVEVESYIELNELETIWMFRYHTWRGYSGGLNLRFPGAKDYKELARMGGLVVSPKQRQVCAKLLEKYRTPENQRKAGIAGGRATASIPGHFYKLGKASKENKIGIFNPNFDRGAAGKIAGSKPENKKRAAEMGHTQGRLNAENGHCARIAKLGGFSVSAETHLQGGKIAFDKKLGIHAPGYDRTKGGKAGAPLANHNRWHVKRNLVNLECKFCIENGESKTAGHI